MKRGTKSLLFGVHQFVLHPLFVFLGWWKLYGFPWDPRVWVCIVVHDWGYWGKAEMDSDEGEKHPELGAEIARKLFGWDYYRLCLGHSRHYVRRYLDLSASRLCYADKLGTALVPRWLYLLLARLSGELAEYRKRAAPWVPETASDAEWHQWIRERMTRIAHAEDPEVIPYVNLVPH